jgi:hypothetical protein
VQNQVSENKPAALRCRAKSKQSGERCKRWATPGKTLCVMHGSKREGIPSAVMTHGLASAYVRKADLPAIVARVAELKTAAGKEHALLTGAALMEHKLENAAPDVIDIDTLATARKSIREDLKTSHELTDEKPVAPTTFVLNNFDPSQHAAFQSRTIDGPCQIRYLDGEPFMLESRCWVPALKQVDDESGAEYYVKLLEG